MTGHVKFDVGTTFHGLWSHHAILLPVSRWWFFVLCSPVRTGNESEKPPTSMMRCTYETNRVRRRRWTKPSLISRTNKTTTSAMFCRCRLGSYAWFLAETSPRISGPLSVCFDAVYIIIFIFSNLSTPVLFDTPVLAVIFGLWGMFWYITCTK